MTTSPLCKYSRSVDHIDPKWEEGRDYQRVCGLVSPLNLLDVELSYNAAKQNKFVPYRVDLFPAPIRFGDMAEFLIGSDLLSDTPGSWVVCEFGGETWWEESRRIGCGSTQNRVWVTYPDFQRECSLKGVESPASVISLGLTFATNGCHDPPLQSARTKGKLVWWNPVLQKHKRSVECPGVGWVRGWNPERFTAHCAGRKRYHNPKTGERKVFMKPPDSNWILGWPN